LKQKLARSELITLAATEAEMFTNFTDAVITCDMPKADLYKFQGSIKLSDGQLVPLSNECLLLKGCQLRNNGHCYGIAVYTGHQTKIMKNALKGRPKKSKIELQTNYYIILTVLIQLCVCIISATYNCLWVEV